MIADFLAFLGNTVFGFINGMLDIFPKMPVDVNRLLDMSGVWIVGEVLGWVNWFLPLDIAASIIALWCTAMLAYLGMKMAIRYSSEVVR